MSAVLETAMPVPPEAPSRFVPRGAERAAVLSAQAETRKAARRARLRHFVTVGGGWVMAGVMGCVAVGAMGMVWNRPAPRDRLAVGFITADGVYEPPVMREDLPKDRRAVLLRHSVLKYLYARENYLWEGVQAQYNLVSAMSETGEQARYQRMMADKKDSKNPELVYGAGIGAGRAIVTRALVQEDRSVPNAVVVTFYLAEIFPGKPARQVRKVARIAWMGAADKIPLAVQQEHNPAAILVTAYDSDPDPEARQETPAR